MNKRIIKRMVLVSAVILLITLGLRTCYYGNPLRSCIYTEEEITLLNKFQTAKVFFIKPAVVLTGGTMEDYSCLPIMGSVDKELIESKYAYIYKRGTQETITPQAGLLLEPIKMVSVTKHGITTIDSGSGPIYYLILKDNQGVLYKVATVSLGINTDLDEYLRAITAENEEIILSPSIKFSDEQTMHY